MYINFLCISQAFSNEIFFLIVFSINFEISAPTNKQTFAKTDFEISVQRSYLKKMCTRNAAGVVGDITEKYCFIPCTIKC